MEINVATAVFQVVISETLMETWDILLISTGWCLVMSKRAKDGNFPY